tara:strand:- start:1024 stop:1587 length:564 start_codon:yes stop_codon:yes gene_type:complete
VAQTYEVTQMSKVAIETNTPVAKTATHASTNTAHDVVAVLAKGEAIENAAKKKRQGVLTQRATCTVALAALNAGKTHYGLNKAVSGALDKAVDDGAISKRLVTQLCKVIKSEHVVRVVSEGNDIAAIKTAMNITDDKPLTWRALLDFAENGAPIVRDPVAALIEAFEKLEPEQAEAVIVYFKEEFGE